jgi:SAM-dependent methyltransferase
VRSQLEAWPNVHVVLGDIIDEGLVHELGPGSFDTCVSFNVLEHILDDNRAMSNMARLLKPGGYVATIVPGCAGLYGTLDVNLGHYRRYEPPLLRALLDAARLELVEIRWMNLPGMLGWFLSSRVFRRSVLPKTALGAFNVLAPLFRMAEALVPVPIGQSLVCVGRKP